ncbi:MAG: hypothetical protein WKG03_07735 [Telluria sp.]
MNRDSVFALAHVGAFAALLFLGGCAYQDINPEAAAADEKANGVHAALRGVDAGTAKLVFRASGAGHAARYSVSTASEACQGFEPVGNVAYSGRGVLLPWIANMTERTRGAVLNTQTHISRTAQPGQSIQVRGMGNWQEGSGLFSRSGNCGPLASRFTPVAGRAYLIDFVWRRDLSCSMVVTDSTDPDVPAIVPADVLTGCAKP